MTSKNFGTKGFQELIYEALEKPSSWDAVKKRYVENEIEHWKKVDERAKLQKNRK